MKKTYFLFLAVFASYVVNAQTLVYSNNFESGVADATIIGHGEIVDDLGVGFGKVYHNNNTNETTPRSNYLLLPENIFPSIAASGSNELSIGFWVNIGSGSAMFNDGAGDYYSSMFGVYTGAPDANGANGLPMMVLESRFWCQLNAFGWTDFSDAENLAGVNNVPPIEEGLTWLADQAWHYYTFTLTPTSAKVYVDAEIINEWEFANNEDGTSSAAGIFTRGDTLTYPTLGGNQAWTWGDKDSSFKYDDIAIYSNVLTAEQIAGIIAAKSAVAISEVKDFGTVVSEEYFTVTGSKVAGKFSDFTPGIYIKRAIYNDGSVKGSKVIKNID